MMTKPNLKTMNLKKYLYVLLALILMPLCSCSDEPFVAGDVAGDGELPVEFTFEWPGMTATRGFDDMMVKTKFSDGDVIHVVGTFRTSTLQEDGSYVSGIVSRYGILKFNGKNRKWEAQEGNKLTWPSTATAGTFYAYYLSNYSTGILTDNPVEVKLAEITPENDPLMAPNTGYMPYGHGVNLQFQHLCAHLTLDDLEPMVSQKYFFTSDDVLDPETKQKKVFNNAFRLTLTENPGVNPDGTLNDSLRGKPALEFEFYKVEDPEYPGLIYISGNPVETKTDDAEGNLKIGSKVGYFLEPGFYEKFTLKYPAGQQEPYNYLTYDYTTIPENWDGVEYSKTEPNLKAGTTYTLTITKSPGVIIESPPSGEGWDEIETPVEVNVPDFLEAVRKGQSYENKDGTLILEQTPEGTKLLHNIDFNNFSYEDFCKLSFTPDVLEGKTFDGNYKYISNLGSPLFRNNYGTIKNIGLKGVNFNGTSVETQISQDGDENDNPTDRSRHGALCMWNRSTARIENVRLSEVSMRIEISYNNSQEDGNEVHNVGCVVGSNTGRINEVELGGKFQLTVTGNNVGNAVVLIGGLGGQNAGNGNISNVSLYDDSFSLSITNQCKGEFGLYAVGGIIGKSSSYISDVILSNVTINGTSSQGVVSYMGGMAGQLEVTGSSTTGAMTDCIVSGTVRAGLTKKAGDIDGFAYTGGMVGYDSNVAVTGCRSAVSVIGTTNMQPDVTYGTGGAFGRIFNPSTFSDLIVYGPKLQSPSGGNDSADYPNYVGNFAGIGPAGQDWDINYAGNNITLNRFVSKNIGNFM